jgi:transcription initiation factor IIE alpha subunit
MGYFLYSCTSQGEVNNGLKAFCNFEAFFEEGSSYHCPLCGCALQQTSTGPSVSEILQRGQRQADLLKEEAKKERKGTNK